LCPCCAAIARTRTRGAPLVTGKDSAPGHIHAILAQLGWNGRVYPGYMAREFSSPNDNAAQGTLDLGHRHSPPVKPRVPAAAPAYAADRRHGCPANAAVPSQLGGRRLQQSGAQTPGGGRAPPCGPRGRSSRDSANPTHGVFPWNSIGFMPRNESNPPSTQLQGLQRAHRPRPRDVRWLRAAKPSPPARSPSTPSMPP
jgi:hypothetical protein